MGPDPGPRGERGDTAAAAPPRAASRAAPHAAARPRQRRRCSWARIDSTRRAGARGPPGRRQSTEAAGVTGGRARPRRRRRMRSSNSRSTSACVRPMISLLASTTMSYPPAVSTAVRWKLSRNSRRARLRTTAPPTFRLTASPSRSFPRSLGRAKTTNSRPSSRVPRRKTRSNSACRLSRRTRPIRVGIHRGSAPALDRQARPSLLSPALQDEPAAARPHTDEKAVRTPAAAVVRLERPLHRNPLRTASVPPRSGGDKPQRIAEPIWVVKQATPLTLSARVAPCRLPTACDSLGGLPTAQTRRPPVTSVGAFPHVLKSLCKRDVGAHCWRRSRPRWPTN